MLCKLAEGRFNRPSVNIKRGVSLWVDTLGNLKHETRCYFFWEDATTSWQMDRNYMVNFNKVRMFFFPQRVSVKKLFSLFRFCFLFHMWSVTALNKISHVRGFYISFSSKRQISYENLQDETGLLQGRASIIITRSLFREWSYNFTVLLRCSKENLNATFHLLIISSYHNQR